jgi:hypothetical protein
LISRFFSGGFPNDRTIQLHKIIVATHIVGIGRFPVVDLSPNRINGYLHLRDAHHASVVLEHFFIGSIEIKLAQIKNFSPLIKRRSHKGVIPLRPYRRLWPRLHVLITVSQSHDEILTVFTGIHFPFFGTDLGKLPLTLHGVVVD